MNTGQLSSSDAGRDMNVERAWLQGLTGRGNVVAVVDDGNYIAVSRAYGQRFNSGCELCVFRY